MRMAGAEPRGGKPSLPLLALALLCFALLQSASLLLCLPSITDVDVFLFCDARPFCLVSSHGEAAGVSRCQNYQRACFDVARLCRRVSLFWNSVTMYR